MLNFSLMETGLSHDLWSNSNELNSHTVVLGPVVQN